MLKRFITSPVTRIALLLLIILVGTAALSGCATTRGAIARGWAGGVIEGGILYTGSMEGNLVAVNITDGSIVLSVPLEAEGTSGGGLLSCMAASSSAVAIYSAPVIADDLVCVAGYNGKVYAFPREEAREEPRWVYPRQGTINGAIIGGIVYGEGKLYFGAANGKVYALDAADGYTEWEYDIGDKIWSAPAVAGNTLYIGSFNKKLYALDNTDGSKKWEFEAEGAIVATPVVYDNTVYISSFDRNLYAINASTGNLRWKYLIDNWLWAKPVVYKGTVYAACLDGKVYAFDAAGGSKKVEYELGSPVASSPVMVDGTLVVATQDGVLYAIDVGSSRQKDLAALEENVFAPLVESGGKVYIHTIADALHEVDALTGAKRQIDIKED